MSLYDYERTLFSYLENLKTQLNNRPLNLGGVFGAAGGAGGPPGGFVGALPQTRVTFDTTEAEEWTIPVNPSGIPSGVSLLTNLNRIRYRIRQVENAVASGITPSGTGHIISNGSPSYYVDLPTRPRIVIGGDLVVLEDRPTEDVTYLELNAPTIPVYLDDLEDVATTTLTTGDVLAWDGSVWTNSIPVAASGVVTVRDATTDTDYTPTVLAFDGDVTLSEVGDTVTVTVEGGAGGGHVIANGIPESHTTFTNRPTLLFGGDMVSVADDDTNDLTYVEISAPYVPTNLDDLDDVAITDVEVNDVVFWDGGSWINGPVPGQGHEIGFGPNSTEYYMLPQRPKLVFLGHGVQYEDTLEATFIDYPRTTETYSKGTTLVKVDGIDTTVNVMVWRVPFDCTAVAVRGFRTGGTTLTVNARKNGTDELLSSDLSVTSDGAWDSETSLATTDFTAGDTLEIMITAVTGLPTQIAVQVDLERQV